MGGRQRQMCIGDNLAVEPMKEQRPPGSSQEERVGNIILALPVSPGGVLGELDGGEASPQLGLRHRRMAALLLPMRAHGVTLEPRPLSDVPITAVGLASEVPVPHEIATTTTTTTTTTQYYDISSNASTSGRVQQPTDADEGPGLSQERRAPPPTAPPPIRRAAGCSRSRSRHGNGIPRAATVKWCTHHLCQHGLRNLGFTLYGPA